jgi:hypothetical protein
MMNRFSFYLMPIAIASFVGFAKDVRAASPAPTATLQLFIQVDGSVPDWQEMALTATRLQAVGVDTNHRPFVATVFNGSQQLSIPRSAAGSARFLVGGTIPAGRVDLITLTLGTVTLATVPPNAGKSPPFWVILLQTPRPLVLKAGDTSSLVVSIELGNNALVTKAGVLLSPILRADGLIAPPTPDNYLNGGEVLEGSLSETLPELGIQVTRAKALDPTAGTVRDLAVQTNNGVLVSFNDLRNQNEALWRSRHGSLDPALVQRLATLGISDTVLADVWMQVPGPQTMSPGAHTPEEWDVAHAAYMDQRRAAAMPIVSAVSTALSAAGATVLSTNLNPPVLHIQAPRGVLETTAANLGNVFLVRETETEKHVLITRGATDLVQQPLQLAHLLGAGAGLRIAIAEDQACVNQQHEAFQGVVWEDPLDSCSGDGVTANDGHSTAVAGALAAFVPETSPDSPNKTRPPGGLVGLFGGRLFTATDCGDISQALLDRSPHLINFSCVAGALFDGVPKGSQMPYDHAVFSDRIFVASGSGNFDTDHDLATQFALCPSYNAVCVGGYTHNNTLGPGNFADDVPAGRYLNDPASHREKPDLVGPFAGLFPDAAMDASALQFPNQAYRTDQGTSFSTPFVVGTAALLMANYQRLVGDPTLTRTVLMASARHGFAGLPNVPVFADSLDDETGAGAPRGDRAREIMEGEQFFSKYVDRNVDFTPAGDLASPLSFVVNAGDRVRVVLSYDQCQISTISVADSLLADLDLVVNEDSVDVSQPGHHVHANNSPVDNTEIVEFTAAAHSQITVKTHAQYWNACTDGNKRTYMAIAWDALPTGTE